MKKFNFRNIPWKSILSGVLLVALVVGSVAGIATLVGKDTKTISSTAFEVGAIDPKTGVYVESKTSIYSEDYIECQGLTIEPDFEATGTYQVFYYSEYKSFIGATEVLQATGGAYIRGEDFSLAKYCRIVITPAVPVDDDGKVEEDFKIHFFNAFTYANDYTITVDKKQSYTAPDLFHIDENNVGKVLVVDESTNKVVAEDNHPNGHYFYIDLNGINALRFEFPSLDMGQISVKFVDANGLIAGGYILPDGSLEHIVDIPENAVRCGVSTYDGSVYSIYPIA